MGKGVKEIRKMMYEQVGYLNKRIDIMKRSQVEILELGSKIVEMKNSLEEFHSRYKQADKRFSKLEYRTIENTQSEEQKEKKNKRK